MYDDGIVVIILYAISGNVNGYSGTGWKTIVYQPVPDSIIY